MDTCDARSSPLYPSYAAKGDVRATVDLLVVTFNCAKRVICPRVFARHLRWAMERNSGGLPEVVVLSLQEVAPLSKAFVGEYFLNGFLERFEEAVNGAAVTMTTTYKKKKNKKQQQQQKREETSPSMKPSDDHQTPFTLVRAGNVGYTAMMLFARHPTRLSPVLEAEVGFGAADMGNKGAVGMRTLYSDPDGGQAELTFVATHLAAMEWNLPRRNANWAAIMRGLTFANPEEVLSGEDGREDTRLLPRGDDDEDEDDENEGDSQQQHARLRRRLHGLSVYKPSSHLFVAGDLNYRIATTPPPPGAVLPSLDPTSPSHFSAFLPLDQLTRERRAGRTLHGLVEAPVEFPPTYKYMPMEEGEEDDGGGFFDERGHYEDGDDDDDDDDDEGDDEDTDVVRWRFASHRWPAWTDRILYLEAPPSDPQIEVRAYDALPVVRTSDHRAVFLRVSVPLSPRSGTGSLAASDPRRRLPVEIDPEAWARRRAARRKERLLGWALLLWGSREGGWVLLLALVVGLSGWYWGFYGVSET
ncbi:Polyphosphatidylinositol phosphatase INP52 [Ophiocordyceps camponoti-floridani]|uniref:Polyphosphatidylinositol phosphatase INP52 n=1 Tax=Ophiocordyceps camponoti-floridani TaxID=2030778 RepID=A0A8H4VGX1_9HYPO|nr:Polyphosphatidylinositol phosphatase INP52 [Ophiocordyceps camponoti-floridani]